MPNFIKFLEFGLTFKKSRTRIQALKGKGAVNKIHGAFSVQWDAGVSENREDLVTELWRISDSLTGSDTKGCHLRACGRWHLFYC